MDLYQRSLNQNAEYNRLLVEDVQVRSGQGRVYEQQVGLQRRGQRWGTVAAVVGLTIIVLVAIFKG